MNKLDTMNQTLRSRDETIFEKNELIENLKDEVANLKRANEHSSMVSEDQLQAIIKKDEEILKIILKLNQTDLEL